MRKSGSLKGPVPPLIVMELEKLDSTSSQPLQLL
jgi:hypothetical protein